MPIKAFFWSEVMTNPILRERFGMVGGQLESWINENISKMQK